jgi:hypothetical protein
VPSRLSGNDVPVITFLQADRSGRAGTGAATPANTASAMTVSEMRTVPK